ncbi:MAG TPA: twin-arginine translocase TatA/TatE family subunit [Gammaproteobacteria bacterium]|jgi:sec-independent protein translocase protein TatA|nr:twin-arginine translocase TatA/TatE family subunit [Gammaproteobacteria bacterium]
MFGLGIGELLIILAIVLLLFGPKRLKTLGSDLGGAIKGFRRAVTDDEAKAAAATPDPRVIEGEIAASNGDPVRTKDSHV